METHACDIKHLSRKNVFEQSSNHNLVPRVSPLPAPWRQLFNIEPPMMTFQNISRPRREDTRFNSRVQVVSRIIERFVSVRSSVLGKDSWRTCVCMIRRDRGQSRQRVLQLITWRRMRHVYNSTGPLNRPSICLKGIPLTSKIIQNFILQHKRKPRETVITKEMYYCPLTPPPPYHRVQYIKQHHS